MDEFYTDRPKMIDLLVDADRRKAQESPMKICIVLNVGRHYADPEWMRRELNALVDQIAAHPRGTPGRAPGNWAVQERVPEREGLDPSGITPSVPTTVTAYGLD